MRFARSKTRPVLNPGKGAGLKMEASDPEEFIYYIEDVATKVDLAATVGTTAITQGSP